ncbi:MAG TPA: hypothetical protein VFU02_16585 [Polyangiaceae bacterium]|nr:hypothetical protein [Polyangiaceae bacterium]
MARTMADILHDYEEAQNELEAVEPYKYDYPESYDQAYSHWESCKAEYEAAIASGVQSVNDEVPWSAPADGAPVPLMCSVEEPVCMSGSGDTLYFDMNRSLHISAQCGHDGGSRKAGPGGVLKIVTGAHGTDKITITNLGLSEDVSYSVSEGSMQKVDGKTASFGAGAPTVSKVWLFSIDPKVYTVTGTSEGETQSITVHAYPDNEIKQSYTISKEISDKIRMLTEAASSATVWAGIEFKITPPSGSLSFGGAWMERPNGAKWAFTASGDLTLWGISGRYPIGIERLTNPLGKIPGVGKELKKLVDACFKAGIYVEGGGKFSLGASYNSEQGADNTVGKLVAEIYLKVGAELLIASEDLLSAELEAGAAVKPYGSLKWDDKGVFVQFGVDFDGLKGSATIKMAYGFLTKGASWTIVNPSQWIAPTDPMYVWS